MNTVRILAFRLRHLKSVGRFWFNFFVNQHLFYALATADIAPLVSALRATKKLPPGTQWAQFLRNHDELDLGRLTEEQRAKVFERFGPQPEMQLYDRGIRRRLAPMLGSQPQLELAYSVMFSLPGTPVIRYGDEIGMGDDLLFPSARRSVHRCNGRVRRRRDSRHLQKSFTR